ncbi:hypothetical protein ONS95_013118 [Cadophora gregata]|uniref:uncharacterized protein n=1 Tax=Cadophora gregata TaxID=51156 RepID=UPI0026DC8233|nr:uncharacterized protein ONS95_013118 [Cadophora gregata]KAK0100067.1 hypothetical protein ONS96_008005 [Cadophora gregata f. sp. sojae]KAK0116086.1 hypothetical protein ONS95_013118 [Cadophora gregata]
MASSVAAQNWQYAQQFEAQLKALLKRDPPPTYDETEHAISQLRIASEAVIFADFQFATTVKAEGRLWDAHTLINGRYRRLMEKVKKHQKNHVERRSLAKHYADFIKTSQFFYKGYIQRLASHFDALQDLRRIANSLSLSSLSVDRRVPVSPEVELLIKRSCHSTLMRLGDLSRYRNSFRTKDRNWAPALGYYALANDFFPENGYAHQQMAVIALAEENHLDALYHLYRALSTKEPHQLASGNLEHEFKKIISAFEKKLPQPKNDKVSTMCGWFNLLHAKFSEGVDFTATREELEREILSRLALLFKEQTFGEILEKLVIVNIAAQYIAGNKAKNDSNEKNLTSYKFYLGFNVRMMFLLLQALAPELENDSEGEEIPNGTNGTADRPEAPREIITAIARRLLPALRQYSTWLASSASFLMAVSTPQTSDVVMANRIIELWKLYAVVLTKLSCMFPVAELPYVEYLLEEDESTVGFEPLLDPNLPTGCNLFKSVKGEIKPRITDQGRAREHPNVEMQSRIRDILIIGLSLAVNNDFPIGMDRSDGGITLVFRPPGSKPSKPLQYSTSSAFPTQSHTSSSFSPREVRPVQKQVERDEHVGIPDVQHSMDSDMSRMVDDLVDPSSQNNETSYGMHSHTANEVFAPIASNGYDSQYRSTPKMLPSLPGLYNSAFTPQPHELKPTSPIRPGTGGQLSPLSLNSEEERREAAAALDKMTGFPASASAPWCRQSSHASSASYKSFAKQLEEGVDDPDAIPPRNSSWVRQSSRPASGSLPRPVSHILQESLAQQFMPMSSNFSDSSSLYANSTPMPARNGAIGSWNGAFSATNGGNSTVYAGDSDFDRETMLQSSIWNGSQNFPGPYVRTPPGGQGG